MWYLYVTEVYRSHALAVAITKTKKDRQCCFRFSFLPGSQVQFFTCLNYVVTHVTSALPNICGKAGRSLRHLTQCCICSRVNKRKGRLSTRHSIKTCMSSKTTIKPFLKKLKLYSITAISAKPTSQAAQAITMLVFAHSLNMVGANSI